MLTVMEYTQDINILYIHISVACVYNNNNIALVNSEVQHCIIIYICCIKDDILMKIRIANG